MSTWRNLCQASRLRSSAEYHPLYIQNLKTRQDYWAHPAPGEVERDALVLESLDAYPGVSVAELLRAHLTLPVDIVWDMLSRCLIFTDLEATLLTRHEHVFCIALLQSWHKPKREFHRQCLFNQRLPI
jgi:hypothetical protein